ncbi:unnamed protein product, partial [Citrullus colocynthis]
KRQKCYCRKASSRGLPLKLVQNVWGITIDATTHREARSVGQFAAIGRWFVARGKPFAVRGSFTSSSSTVAHLIVGRAHLESRSPLLVWLGCCRRCRCWTDLFGSNNP